MPKRTLHTCFLLLLLFIVGLAVFFFTRPAMLTGDLSFDFGTIQIPRPSKTLEHTFRLVNASGHELRITDAIPSCACTTVTWSPDAVQPGGEFSIPVTLDMQRSQYRSATVRLEFASGEMEVLRIQGVAHFEQPLQCMPPTVLVASDDTEGSRSIVSLEWYEDTTPPSITFTTPENIIITADAWKKSKVGNPNKGTPDKWTSLLKIVLVGELGADASFSLFELGAPELVVPLVQTESIERPNFLKGGIR